MDQPKTPKITVVMAAYNGEATLARAVDSILAQTFKEFEFIIINDGSTDKTAQILDGYDDARLHIITQENQGLVASLNRGIKQAKAPLIARQDADDASNPERLQRQYDALAKQAGTVIVGSSIHVMDESGTIIHDHYVLLADAELKQELLVRSPFAHGSVLFRKSAFDQAGDYQQADWPAEDYGLWVRMAATGAFANIDEPLYSYREGSASISTDNQQLQLKQRARIRVAAWKLRRGLLPSSIDSTNYLERPMGQFRIERITSNLLFAYRRSVTKLDVRTASAMSRLLLRDGRLRRKCARLVLVKLGLKRG